MCGLCVKYDFRKVGIEKILDETIIVFTSNLNDIEEEKKFKYCPGCGRRLTNLDFKESNRYGSETR